MVGQLLCIEQKEVWAVEDRGGHVAGREILLQQTGRGGPLFLPTGDVAAEYAIEHVGVFHADDYTMM